MAQKSGAVDATAAVPFVSNRIMLWSLGGICGYIAFGFICDTIGCRATVMLYSAGTIVFGLILYLVLPEFEPSYPRILPIFGSFVFGVFSSYSVYLPELFPTHIRSPAVGFCTGSARIITSFGPLVAGLLVGAFGGSFNRVTAFMTCFCALEHHRNVVGRETMGDPLP
jgi:sugar phosphate permease